jgi:hypothetical protein
MAGSAGSRLSAYALFVLAAPRVVATSDALMCNFRRDES